MEALVTLGLAANIVQFVDFGLRILSKSKEIYRSAEGSSQDTIVLEAVVNQLKATQSRIQGYSTVPFASAQRLQEESTKLINELLGTLEELKAKGKPSKWKSVRKALKSVRSKEKINQWLFRLESIRHAYNWELEVDILETLQWQGSEQTKAFQDLEQSQQALIQTLLNAFRDNRDALEAVAENHSIDIQQLVRQEHQLTRAENESSATATRTHVTVEHEQTRGEVVSEATVTRQQLTIQHTQTRIDVESAHEKTRNHVSQETAQAVSRNEHTAEKHANLVQDDVQRSQFYTENTISAEVNSLARMVKGYSDIAQIGADRQFSALSHQLAETRLELNDLRRRQELEHPLALDHRSSITNQENEASGRIKVNGAVTATPKPQMDEAWTKARGHQSQSKRSAMLKWKYSRKIGSFCSGDIVGARYSLEMTALIDRREIFWLQHEMGLPEVSTEYERRLAIIEVYENSVSAVPLISNQQLPKWTQSEIQKHAPVYESGILVPPSSGKTSYVYTKEPITIVLRDLEVDLHQNTSVSFEEAYTFPAHSLMRHIGRIAAYDMQCFRFYCKKNHLELPSGDDHWQEDPKKDSSVRGAEQLQHVESLETAKKKTEATLINIHERRLSNVYPWKLYPKREFKVAHEEYFALYRA